MDRLLEKRVVPIVGLEDERVAVPVAEAILAGGLDVFELTLRTPAALGGIRRITERFPGASVGAGTVLTPTQVEEAAEAGATFIVTPGLNPAVVEKSQALGLPIFPGVLTPSEIEHAIRLGCKVLKFFPAENLGGVATLKAVSAPYGHTGVRFIPLGGIHEDNMRDYLTLPTVAAIGGSWLAARPLMVNQDWAGITARTRKALALAAEASR